MDLVLSGALIVDGTGTEPFVGDVGVHDGAVAEVRQGPGTIVGLQVVQLAGHVLTPGLVDIHAHVVQGKALSVTADQHCLTEGVTSVVDAGSAGGPDADDILATVATARTRVFALVNLAAGGLAEAFTAGELVDHHAIDAEGAIAAMQNHDAVIGLKVRCDAHAVGTSLDVVLDAAERVETRPADRSWSTSERHHGRSRPSSSGCVAATS